MPTYTLVFTRPSGGQTSNVADFPDDASIVEDAKGVLGQEVVSVAVARGAPLCEAEFLGVWDLADGQPRWTPDSET